MKSDTKLSLKEEKLRHKIRKKSRFLLRIPCADGGYYQADEQSWILFSTDKSYYTEDNWPYIGISDVRMDDDIEEDLQEYWNQYKDFYKKTGDRIEALKKILPYRHNRCFEFAYEHYLEYLFIEKWLNELKDEIDWKRR